MQTVSLDPAAFGSRHASIDPRDLKHRVSPEFREMPGLVIRLAQTPGVFSVGVGLRERRPPRAPALARASWLVWQ
jgi:hypothetical protein